MSKMCKILHMETITMPIAKGRARFSAMIEKAKSGKTIIFTNHGQPEAILSGYRIKGKRWRLPYKDDPKRYGDLQKPVMEPME